jgi:hypothetical protein
LQQLLACLLTPPELQQCSLPRRAGLGLLRAWAARWRGYLPAHRPRPGLLCLAEAVFFIFLFFIFIFYKNIFSI